MVNPSMVGGAGIGASVGGTILSVLGAKQTGEAQQQQFGYQAGMARVAKQVALQNKDYALTTGETENRMYGMRAGNVMGKIKAAQGASGLDIGSGSAVKVREGQQLVTNMDEATIRANTARKAYGYDVEAAQDEAQAGLYDMAGANAKKATKLNIASSLLSGVGSVSSKWLQGKQVGLWGADA